MARPKKAIKKENNNNKIQMGCGFQGLGDLFETVGFSCAQIKEVEEKSKKNNENEIANRFQKMEDTMNNELNNVGMNNEVEEFEGTIPTISEEMEKSIATEKAVMNRYTGGDKKENRNVNNLKAAANIVANKYSQPPTQTKREPRVVRQDADGRTILRCSMNSNPNKLSGAIVGHIKDGTATRFAIECSLDERIAAAVRAIFISRTHLAAYSTRVEIEDIIPHEYTMKGADGSPKECQGFKVLVKATSFN